MNGRSYRRLFAGVIVAFTGLAVWSGCGSRGTSIGAIPEGASGAGSMARGISVAVTNTKDAGAGSLRAAIEGLNGKGAAHASITFSVSGTIRLASDLPAVAVPLLVDGASAPGYAGRPRVEVDANGHGGFVFASGAQGSKLVGIAIGNAGGDGVTLDAGSITVERDYVGLNLAGAAFGNHGDGIYVSAQSSEDRIGFNASGDSGDVANVISGNAGNGVSLHGTSGNVVAANRIGTDPGGKVAIANRQNGIWITAASKDNEIGGTRFVDKESGLANNPTGSKGTVPPVFVVPPDGNLISGNGANGILIDAGSQANTLNGNFIGTTSSGDGTIANAGDGVRISGADGNSLVGCKVFNNPFVYYNVMSGNLGNGLRVTNSDDVLVQGNFFGVGANNTTVIANGGDGMLIDGTSQGTTVGGVIPLGNVSAGNVRNGIEVSGKAGGFITYNTFGGLLAFKGAAPNGNDGVLITATGGNQTVRTNVFSGNIKNGIEIGGDAWGVTVDPDIVGLSTKGNSVLPNGLDGVRIDGTAHDNAIGGYQQSVIPENTFSGNLAYGLAILDGAHDNRIFNDFLGVDVLGRFALANQKGGVYVGANAYRNLIGGAGGSTKEPKRNLVSGNVGNGVTLGTGSSYTSLIANWIGLNRAGAKTLPNSGEPIVVRPGSVHNRISGNKT